MALSALKIVFNAERHLRRARDLERCVDRIDKRGRALVYQDARVHLIHGVTEPDARIGIGH